MWTSLVALAVLAGTPGFPALAAAPRAAAVAVESESAIQYCPATVQSVPNVLIPVAPTTRFSIAFTGLAGDTPYTLVLAPPASHFAGIQYAAQGMSNAAGTWAVSLITQPADFRRPTVIWQLLAKPASTMGSLPVLASGSAAVVRLDCTQLRSDQPRRTAVSPDGRVVLGMQGDGNLVLRSGGRAIWSSGTYGHAGSFAVLQGDGNLVVRAPDGRALWNSGSARSRLQDPAGVELFAQDDGNLVLRDRLSHRALWVSGTTGRA